MSDAEKGHGTREDPWVLQTPPGTSEYPLYRDESADPPALVCVVGKTTLSYQLRCLEDLHAMLVGRPAPTDGRATGRTAPNRLTS